MQFCCKIITDLLPDLCESLTKLIHSRSRSATFLLLICIKLLQFYTENLFAFGGKSFSYSLLALENYINY